MLQLGRVGLGPTLYDPEVWDHSGEQVSVSGVLEASTVDDAKALRQQILGLLKNPDEPTVPVIWDQDSWVDGYYRVLDARVPTVPASYTAKWFPFSVTLERVSDYSIPLIESILLAPNDIRDHDHAIAEARQYLALPASAIVGAYGTPTNVGSEEGNITVQIAQVSAGGVFHDTSIRYTLAPADWYDGACRIELDYANNGTYRPVVGRQIPNLPGERRWRISNGIIRVTLEDPTSFFIGLSRWTGSTWPTPTEFFLGLLSGVPARIPFPIPDTISVIRNSPDTSILRFSLIDTNIGLTFVDIILRRGMSWCEVRYVNGNITTYAAGRSTTDSSAVFTNSPTGMGSAGHKNNAADGNGFLWIVGTPWTIDASSTVEGFIGTVVNPATDPPSFAIGMSLDTGSADAPSRPEGSMLNYLAAQYETLRVAER